MVRKAIASDIARISEIIVFANRLAYRLFLNNDVFEFNDLQVLTVARELRKPGALDGIFVFDDGIVKGMVNLLYQIENGEQTALIKDFYVDPFFQQNGIGCKLFEYALNESKKHGCIKINLFVYTENDCAAAFCRNFGFVQKCEAISDKRTGKSLSLYTKTL